MLKNFAVLLLLTAVHASSQISMNFEIHEETEVNSTIGSIRDVVPTYSGTKTVFIYTGDFFNVDSQSGEVKVKTVLDRESLCQEHKQCCGTVNCTLTETVYVINAQTRNLMTPMHLRVKVNDINDNKPIFASSIQRVSIPENSEVGKSIGLRPATDADVDPRNKVTRYQWSEATETFSLDQTSLPAIRLRLNSPVDREVRSNYSGVLSACDIHSCTSTDVLIEIEDVNDNLPQLYKRRYGLEISESLAVGSTILHMNATDRDSAENARIFYSFREPVDPDLVDTFEIVANTGEIRLRRPLDAKIRSSYEFSVTACDTVASECSSNPTSNADVEVVVKDVNDNKPIIEIVPAGESVSSSDDLVVPENYLPGQIAVVRVKDADIGENSRTTCELDSHTTFELSHSAPGLYSLQTLRSFDFEQESILTTIIRCRDFGSPSLSSTQIITLRILDVNEYPPEFQMHEFKASVSENSPPGVEVISLNAVDRDGQSELSYSLAPPPLQQGASEDFYGVGSLPNTFETLGVNAYFDLDPKTGVLRTSRVQLDREVIERITLVVTVTDALTEPIFTATATVSIEVLDENDNSPVFVNPPANIGLPFDQNDLKSHTFTIRENAPRYSHLSGRLEARDPDADQNGQLQFSLRSVWALKSVAGSAGHSSGNIFDDLSGTSPGRQLVEQRIFQITPDGDIETLVEFDRELVAMYLLNVAVRDNGSQPLATSTSLLVRILDENDNAPEWTFPTESARQINITTASPPGSLVARLQAFDVDADDAGKVEFQVLDLNGQPMPPVSISRGLYNAPAQSPRLTSTVVQEELMGYRTGPFYLNGSTGEILVADRLVPLNLKIRLRAIDCGHAQRLFTDTWMAINVKMDPNEFGGFLGGGRTGALNVTIILVMIAVTAIISLLLIIAIVCVRRKPGRAVVGNGTAVEPEGRVVAYSPGSPFLTTDPSKEALTTNTWTGLSKDFYPPLPGGLPVDENGRSYGSPLLGSDKTSIFCGVPPQDSMYTLLEPNEDIISGTLPLHTFGTMSRNSRQAGILASIQGSTTGIRMAGSLQYDADSGDSGRGPSEDGNQLMMLENQRVFPSYAGYPYATCAGYRSASRMSYGPRSASAIGAPLNGCISGGGVINTSPHAFTHNAHNNGDNCCSCCHVEEQQQLPQSPFTAYGDYMDTGSSFGVQRSPLAGYRTSHLSPTPQRYTPGAGETTISASISSLPRSRAHGRSTVTIQSLSIQQQNHQQPIKLDLRGPVEMNAGEAVFSNFPPRPTPRDVSNLDDNKAGD
ncbi:Protocadherin 18 [Echinococcus granulosus]|uniref:Protocadherin 9 n=1 Tax=Echinococcus granulosus TaxID=6210 RepID=A0A068WWV1_ECHGR|nr:Protocadherin 18 [Echinococcus granulosus]CDS22121.1 protocadherin 9 [Echinococcus granulosus]